MKIIANNRKLSCIVILAGICTAVWGQEQLVASLDKSGTLSFSQLSNAVSYRVEWCPNLVEGNWSTNWSSLEHIVPSGTGTVKVAVPMFYRVVASVAPGVPVTNNLITAEGTTDFIATSGSVVGDQENTNDGNDETYYGVYQHHGGDGTAECWIQREFAWPSAIHLDMIRSKMYARPYPHGNYESQVYTFEVSLKLNGSWTQVYRDHRAYNSSTPGNQGHENRDITMQDGWDNCTGMRIYVYAKGYSYEGDRQQEAWARIFEVEALSIQNP